MSLTSLLPAPRHASSLQEIEPAASSSSATSSSSSRFDPPVYGSRAGFVPRSLADYGDGGSFPEIHILQYPLNMGKKDKKGALISATNGSSTALVPLSLDNKGEVEFDSIIKRGHASHVVVHTGIDGMREKNESKMDLSKPSEEDNERMAEETKKALGMIVEKKIATGMPTHVAKHSKEAVFIKYTPSEQSQHTHSTHNNTHIAYLIVASILNES